MFHQAPPAEVTQAPNQRQAEPLEAGAPQIYQQVRLLPVDEAQKNQSFFDFRQKLMLIIKNRDAASLIRLIRKDTELGFDGSMGQGAFVEWWHPGDPHSKLWVELQTVLQMGGAFDGEGNFVAPYVSARWPDQFDEFLNSAVIGKNVPCYPSPDSASKPFCMLSYEVVNSSVDDSNVEEFEKLDKQGWRKIELWNGKVGYIRSQFLRSAIDQRIYFAKDTHGDWFISAFVAGD